MLKGAIVTILVRRYGWKDSSPYRAAIYETRW